MEFANRLHLLNGLVHSEHTEEASAYLTELLGSGPLGSALPGIEAIRDPFLQAFLAAKGAVAREGRGDAALGPNTWAPGWCALPVDATTVLGNLLDNAIDAVRMSDSDVKVVKSNCCRMIRRCTSRWATPARGGAGFRRPGLHRRHLDQTGVRAARRARRRPGCRVRSPARSAEDVRLSSPGNPDAELCGAEFIARLPGVMVEEV